MLSVDAVSRSNDQQGSAEGRHGELPLTAGPRYSLAVLLGVAGLALNLVELPLLSPETPEFVFGGATLLLSFVLLGNRAGLVTSAIALSPLLVNAVEAEPRLAAAVFVYTLEAFVASKVYERSGSLVFSVTIFWLVGGWALDLLVYHSFLGLTTDYTVVLYLKQFLNGMLNAIGAEIVLLILSSRGVSVRPTAEGLNNRLFGRVSLAAGIPLLLLAIVATRQSFERDLRSAFERQDQMALELALSVEQYLEDRRHDVARLARTVAATSDERSLGPILRRFHEARPEYLNLGIADAAGTIVESVPARTARGTPIAGLDISDRSYFQTLRDDLDVTYSDLILGALHVRDPENLEPILVLAEPLIGPGNTFRGLVVAALDVLSAAPRFFDGLESTHDELLTVFDRNGLVVGSEDPGRPTGSPLGAKLRESIDREGRSASFSYFPEPSPDFESRLSLDLRHATVRHLQDAPISILVETPAASLHRLLAPLALQILALVGLALLLLFVAIALVTRSLSSPLSVLERASRRVTEGDFPPERRLDALREHPVREIRVLAQNFRAMQESLAYRDALTGLPNLHRFRDELDGRLERDSESERAVILVDLDAFQRLENEAGSSVARLVLQTLARRFDGMLDPGEIVARGGLDEFYLLLTLDRGSGSVGSRILDLRERLLLPIAVEDRTILVTASIGVALAPDDGADAESLIAKARAAMIEAKKKGRDTYRFYSPEIEKQTIQQVSVLSDLQRATRQEGELGLAFQPILSLSNHEVVRVEALVRWNHPERGEMSPGTFVPLIENSDLVLDLDRWVLGAATSGFAEALGKNRSSQLSSGLGVAVNLSARTCQSDMLLDWIREALERTGLEPRQLEIEITESTAIHDFERATEALERIRDLGCSVALDDFGVGYASLGYLRQLPVDRIKLDRTYVTRLDRDPMALAIAESVVSMGRQLDLGTVAEGVESRGLLGVVESLGFQEAQGYVIGRPGPLQRALGASVGRLDEAIRLE